MGDAVVVIVSKAFNLNPDVHVDGTFVVSVFEFASTSKPPTLLLAECGRAMRRQADMHAMIIEDVIGPDQALHGNA